MGNEKSRNQQGLTEKEISVLKANTNFSEAEIRETYEEFHRECPSGKMNKSQFCKYFVKFIDPQRARGDLADSLFPVFDQNSDGTVTFSELVLGSAVASNNDMNGQLELGFEMIDSSGDGSISYQELVKFIEYAKKMPQRHISIDPDTGASLIFDTLGLNKNQKISKKQFLEGVKNNQQILGMLGGYTQ